MEHCDHKKYDGVQITVISKRDAIDPNLPSHLFHGSGSDGVRFKVTAGEAPDTEGMNDMLNETFPSCCNVDYNQETGAGQFVLIDEEAPAPGTVISLKNINMHSDASWKIEDFYHAFGKKTRTQALFEAQLFPFGMPSDLCRMTFLNNLIL